MPRKPRVWYPGAMYHVTARGNRKNNLFRDRKDYQFYLTLLQKANEKLPFILHSYCLMPNHIHLIIETIEDPLSQIIHYVHSNYAKYFNKKYDYIGHVFQDRYFAKLIKNWKQIMDTSSYIHLNPVRSRYVKNPEDYYWSSYKTFIISGYKTLADPTKILKNLGDHPNDKYKFYVETKLNTKDWGFIK
ncbi:REP-associated tyrosine transposase [Rossellomorea arthrocnemi]|jgi:putative transposase|uniref:REP-associated tyrosine transposase n=1 Tax=Rossellomorea arthrocnemi TaxID=2769542 RepID=UPI001918C6CE|nr:transposase [Rossellomorea arthrocnemi]